MALTDENGGIPATMLVSPASFGGSPYPVYMGNGQSSGNGNGFGEDGWWIVLLFILLAGSRGFGGYGGGEGFGGSQPIIVNDGGSSVQRGFDQASVMSGINSVQSGVQNLSTQLCNCCGDISAQLCNGFAGVNATVNGAQNAIAQQLYGNQIASMQQAFAAQTAMSQGFNQIGSQFADCCCENRLASADLKYTIATENCADRAAISDGIRDILTNNTANTQRILDKLCDQELQAERRENENLRQQIYMKDLAASQIAQTAQITAGQNAAMNSLVNELRSCPIPCQPVYGSTPIFTCNNSGCGCNGGNF